MEKKSYSIQQLLSQATLKMRRLPSGHVIISDSDDVEMVREETTDDAVLSLFELINKLWTSRNK